MNNIEGNSQSNKFETALIKDGEINTATLKPGETLKFSTLGSDQDHREYKLEAREDGLYISGNPDYCPDPIKIDFIASNIKGAPVSGHIATSEKLRIVCENGTTFLTSPVQEIERNLE